MRISARRRDDAEVNLTPLIDVVFLLLIFFMVSTTFERESELGIELPEANATAEASHKAQLEVSIDRQGRYYVDGRPLINTQQATLLQAMRQRVKEIGADPPVLVTADGNASHQSVIAVMDAAQQLGLTRLRFPTQNVDTESDSN